VFSAFLYKEKFMEYITYFGYILICGLLNRVRGNDDINRFVFNLSNFFLSYISFGDITLSLIISLGIWVWLSRGWYKYTMSHMGDLSHLIIMKEVKTIDKLTDKLCGMPDDYDSARNWGTVGMALRGFLLSIPLFVGLGYYLDNYWLSLLSIPMLLQGIIYRQVHDVLWGTLRIKRWYKYGTAEIITGMLYSSLITTTILLANG
jgi:hypothetical protein